MKSSTRTANITALCLLLGVGTACNIHDNTINIPNATINATANADVTAVVPAQTVPITVTVQNVYLVAPDVTPPPEHAADAGYLKIYLDDVDTTPLLITADVMFNVTIPAATKPGPHNIVCRFHKHDGTPTTTEFNVAITVAASVGADGGVDVVTSVDANVTTGGVGGSTTTGAGGAAGAAGAGG